MQWRRAEPSDFCCRLAEESSDDVFREETRPAAESLVLAGRCVLLAARKLQVQPDNPSHREELAASAKRVLTETLKVTAEGNVAGASRGGGRAGKGAAARGTRAALHQDTRRSLGEVLTGAMVISSSCAHQGRSAGQNTPLPYKGCGVVLAAQGEK